jgi:hypothetical protein
MMGIIRTNSWAFNRRFKDKDVFTIGDKCTITERSQTYNHLLEHTCLRYPATFIVEEIIYVYGGGTWLKVKGKEDEWVHTGIVEVINKRGGNPSKEWLVDIKFESRKERTRRFVEAGEDPEDYEIVNFYEVEISVLKTTNKHGKESYGWDGRDKLILLDTNLCDTKEFEWYKKAAKILCDGLNKLEE